MCSSRSISDCSAVACESVNSHMCDSVSLDNAYIRHMTKPIPHTIANKCGALYIRRGKIPTLAGTPEAIKGDVVE